ncbi:MAG: hypothetical protein Pg6C_09710 [Treponemataceae bacterium]|nr:MAG: hypothetical protein Pg6C_09710 [Treponemataceae bacterium]
MDSFGCFLKAVERMRVRVKVFFTIIIMAVIITVAATGAGLVLTQNHLQQAIERDMSTVSETVDKLLTSEINLLKANVSTAVRYLAGFPSGEDLHRILEEQTALYPGFLALTVIQPIFAAGVFDGAYVADFAGSPPVHTKFITSEFVSRAASGESIISTTRIDPATGKLVLHVCVPMNGGRVLAATVDGGYFSDVLDGLTIWETGHIFVIDGEGALIAGPTKAWVNERRNFIELAQEDAIFQDIGAVFSKMTLGRQGMGTYSLDGVERFCAYRRISGSKSGWSLGVIAPINEGPLRNMRNGMMIAALVCIGMSILAAFFVSGILEAPYRTISDMVRVMKRQENLLHSTNRIAEILLRSDSARFDADIRMCMKMMAESVDGTRMRIFQNTDEADGELGTTLVHEWLGGAEPGKLRNFQYSEHKRDRSAKLVRAPIPYARVLVVDDVPVNLDVARGLLKPYGMTVDCVMSGKETIALIKKGNPRYNAVFMDHMMPEMDGIEAVKIIREEIGTEYARTLPIIALTANALAGNEEMFLSKGFQSFLSKPIDIMALDTAVNRWVRDRALEKELAADDSARGAAERDDSPRENLRTEFLAAWNVAGVDAKRGIDAYFGGDVKIYAGILASYVTNTSRLLDQIRGFDGKTADNAKLADYAITVHGMKSASRSIGAEALGAKAEKLELAAKAGDRDFVDSAHGDFIKTAQTVVESLSGFLNTRETSGKRLLKSSPDSAVLSALHEACKNYDADAADEAMKALESFRYENGGDLIPWLREQIVMSEFDAITERLALMLTRE